MRSRNEAFVLGPQLTGSNPGLCHSLNVDGDSSQMACAMLTSDLADLTLSIEREEGVEEGGK